MIQRVQSLFLFFAVLLNTVILFYAPIFISSEEKKIIMKDLQYPSLLLVLSTLLALFAIFQFKNRIRQLMIVYLSRLCIAISFLIFILFKEDENQLYYGSFLLILPYIILFFSAYFIKKDDKLVKSADRIR
jgi:predicted neutral ceramidase superfamily lipid hydrolase